MAWLAYGKPRSAGAGRTRMVRGLDPAAADLAGSGGDRGVLPVQGIERGVGSLLVAQHWQQVERVLVFGQPAGMLALGLHPAAVMTASSRGSGSSSGLKCVISPALPALPALSWPITTPVTWVTAPSRCTLAFLPALASLRSLPSYPLTVAVGVAVSVPVAVGVSVGVPVPVGVGVPVPVGVGVGVPVPVPVGVGVPVPVGVGVGVPVPVGVDVPVPVGVGVGVPVPVPVPVPVGIFTGAAGVLLPVPPFTSAAGTAAGTVVGEDGVSGALCRAGGLL